MICKEQLLVCTLYSALVSRGRLPSCINVSCNNKSTEANQLQHYVNNNNSRTTFSFMHACTLVLVHPFIVSAVQTETFTAATLCYKNVAYMTGCTVESSIVILYTVLWQLYVTHKNVDCIFLPQYSIV